MLKIRPHSGKTTGGVFVIILSALMVVTSLSTDFYFPAMPFMSKELQSHTELTVSGFLTGFCIAPADLRPDQ